jgi:hypothetical protein
VRRELVPLPSILVKPASTRGQLLSLSAEGYRAFNMLVPRLSWIGRFATALRELGPYAVIGLLVPGGTLILVSLWAFQHRAWFAARARRGLGTLVALGVSLMVTGCTWLAAPQSTRGDNPRTIAWHSLPRNAALSAGRLLPAALTDIFPCESGVREVSSDPHVDASRLVPALTGAAGVRARDTGELHIGRTTAPERYT